MNKLLKSKTVWAGAILGLQQIFTTLLPAAQSGMLGPKVQGVITGLGIILGAVGVRSAISKELKK